tara:strand:+ start:50729 stop:51142 length:414 start_codon:yes stop_codon:yes gene_type:complete
MANVESLKGIKILVAEDNEINAMIISKYFIKWEVDFDIAPNGEKAIEFAKNKCYDLILSDIHMPVLNGYDATKAIRKNKDSLNKDIPIYALSGSIDIEVKDEIEQSGMNGLIYKPYRPDELYNTILQILHTAQTIHL